MFSINCLTYPELSKCVGNILIQDLKEFTGLKPPKQKLNIILDEFNVFASENVINLINKSRAFNYQCFLSFQTIDDLNLTHTNLTNIIFGNVTSIICHRVTDPNTAEYIASVFGTQESEKLTRQIDFNDSTSQMGSIRAVEEFIIHPNELKKLNKGECYLKTTLPSGKIYINNITVLP